MSVPFRADMHCHSTCSDGSLNPSELVDLAAKEKLGGLAITDHDTIDSYTDELFAQAKGFGLRLCTGVEFSSRFHLTNVHILGYNFDVTKAFLKSFCSEHQERRLERNLKILSNLKKEGLYIAEEELYDPKHQGVIGRPHIAKLMIDKGYVSDFQEAFRVYLSDQGSCFDPGRPYGVEETIEVIREAGGKAFLAHPHFIKKRRLLKDILDLGFDGIECYYSQLSKDQELPMVHLAEERELLISGGSDFHGDLKPHVQLGSSWVDEETFNKIVEA